MALLVATVLSHDRPGLIADVTGVLAQLGGNLEDSSMTLLHGHFAWTLVFDVDAEPEQVRERLSEVCPAGVAVSYLDVAATARDYDLAALGDQETELAGVSVHGADRPGIVSAITRVIADFGGNITDLTTRLGNGLYVVVCEVEFVAGTDLSAVQDRLSEVAAGLGVTASIRTSDPDLL